jgi:hypothetical protein
LHLSASYRFKPTYSASNSHELLNQIVRRTELPRYIHASQYPNAGIFGSSTLLTGYASTPSLEASLSDLQRLGASTEMRIPDSLPAPPLAYYATTHVHSTNLLAELCLEQGQRALIVDVVWTVTSTRITIGTRVQKNN